MNKSRYLIDPELSCAIIVWLGWALIVMGAIKMVIYLIGEIRPGTWDKIKSPTFKKLLTGKGNRLLFGLGGFFTILFGAGAIGFAILIRHLNTFF